MKGVAMQIQGVSLNKISSIDKSGSTIKCLETNHAIYLYLHFHNNHICDLLQVQNILLYFWLPLLFST